MNTTHVGQEIAIEEYKRLLKEMLSHIHTICYQNNVKYFVSFGTLIGAIRHNGFIPWDDDVDICMLRSEYERFTKLLQYNLYGLYLLSSERNSDYYFYFPRVCSNKGILKLKGIADIDNLGPFIDIFIIDKITENKEERIAYYQKIIRYNNRIKSCLSYRQYKTLPPPKRIEYFLKLPLYTFRKLFIGKNNYKKRRLELFSLYNNSDSKLFICAYDNNSELYLMTEDEVNKIELHKFEDIEVCIPSEYDSILRRQYGDYMQLPPEDKRISQHHFIPYWRDNLNN